MAFVFNVVMDIILQLLLDNVNNVLSLVRLVNNRIPIIKIFGNGILKHFIITL